LSWIVYVLYSQEYTLPAPQYQQKSLRLMPFLLDRGERARYDCIITMRRDGMSKHNYQVELIQASEAFRAALAKAEGWQSPRNPGRPRLERKGRTLLVKVGA
jgi:hypothetical protein